MSENIGDERGRTLVMLGGEMDGHVEMCGPGLWPPLWVKFITFGPDIEYELDYAEEQSAYYRQQGAIG